MTNLKTRAVVRTALMMLIFTLAPLAVYAITTFVPTNVLLIALGVGGMVFFVGMLYEVNLSRIQYEDKLKEITKK